MNWKRKKQNSLLRESEIWEIGSGAHELDNGLGLGFKNVGGAHEAGAEDDAHHSCIEPTCRLTVY